MDADLLTICMTILTRKMYQNVLDSAMLIFCWWILLKLQSEKIIDTYTFFFFIEIQKFFSQSTTEKHPVCNYNDIHPA